ncbi:hypothetical protein ALC60_06378 [Trachymyrmex zeteki]|uniref:MADF domain-containing protein n=1 Tax=Mycetomoellerius zeteki TaxID=64791 RepID=A0A151X2X6_9HYME|nr:hypothetical protein ALC60_06378 [Trachymyrmex zeteki]
MVGRRKRSSAHRSTCNAILYSLVQVLHAPSRQLLAQVCGKSERPGSPSRLLSVIKRGTVRPIRRIMAQWRQETILKLIGAYRARRLLWDHNAPDYTDRSKRIYAWKEIADELGCDVMTVERKLKSLKTHFMSVHKAYAKRRLKADSNPGSVIKPKWFAYEALTFLNKGRLLRINRETPNVEKQNPVPTSNWKQQETPSGRDEFTVFAEHVAIRLKNIADVRARLVAQHQINNILFEAEMGKYSIQTSFGSDNPEIMEHLDEPSTSNEEKVMINNIPHAI